MIYDDIINNVIIMIYHYMIYDYMIYEGRVIVDHRLVLSLSVSVSSHLVTWHRPFVVWEHTQTHTHSLHTHEACQHKSPSPQVITGLSCLCSAT